MSLQNLEAKFTTASNLAYEKFLDLNVTQSEAQQHASQLLNLRSDLLAMYGVPKEGPTFKPPTAGIAAAGAVAGVANGNVETQFKALLNQAMAKREKKGITKEDVIFTTVPVDEQNKSFVSRVSSPLLSAEFQGESPSISKKLAEQAAAKAALQTDFPEFFATLGAAAPVAVAVVAGRGQKRKADDQAVAMVGKQKLNHGMAVLLGRPLAKDECVFEVAETPGQTGQFSATVRLPCYQNQVFTGESAATKKDAEANAAEAAVQALQSVIDPAIEQLKAKRTEKSKASVAKMSAAQKEKKLAKAAAAAAAGVAA